MENVHTDVMFWKGLLLILFNYFAGREIIMNFCAIYKDYVIFISSLVTRELYIQ